MFSLFKKNKNRSLKLFYPELPPNDRIRKVIEVYIYPNLKPLGFRMLKSKLIIKRDLGDFSQEIFFKTSRKNSSDLCIKFHPHFFVKNNFYSKWYKTQYDENIPNDYRISNNTLWVSGNNIPNWGETFNSYSWYDLLVRDNQVIVDELNHKIINVALPYMNLHSNINSAIDMILNNNLVVKTSMILDFCEMTNNKSKALKIKNWYLNKTDNSKVNLDKEVKIEIEKRLKRMISWI